MGFFKKAPEFDLGELSIENMFITDFMPSASGTYVKVYLLGLMFSKEENIKYHYDNRTLANMLSLPLQDVHEAWGYWTKTGLVVKHPHDEGQDYDIEFLSLRALYIQNNFSHKSQRVEISKKQDSKERNAFKTENENFTRLTKSVEKIVGHPLTYAEYRDIGDFYENYSKDTDWILKAFEHCFNERGIRSLKVVKSTMLAWIDQGLVTRGQVEDYLAQSGERNAIYKEVLKLLGIGYRMINQGEKDLVDKWLDTYEVSPVDLFEIVKDLSKRTLNISFNYIDKAISSLTSQGIKTYDAYKNSGQKDKASPSKKKSYTIEKDKTYSEEELEHILLNKNK